MNNIELMQEIAQKYSLESDDSYEIRMRIMNALVEYQKLITVNPRAEQMAENRADSECGKMGY